MLFWSRGGPPPCVLAPDHTVTNLSWRIFGVIQNPSGFGVFRPVLPRGFKGFDWNVFISQKSLLKVENLVANLAFWPIFIYVLITLVWPYPLSSQFVVQDVVQAGSLSVTLGQTNLAFVSTIFCFLDEKLKLLKIRRDLDEISPNLQEFQLFNEPSFFKPAPK